MFDTTTITASADERNEEKCRVKELAKEETKF